MTLLWGPVNLDYGIGFISCPDDLVIHIYKIRIDHRRNTRKQPYHWTVEQRGTRTITIFDSNTDPFEVGGRDFREAKQLAENWYHRRIWNTRNR